jgi:hypothetical protein
MSECYQPDPCRDFHIQGKLLSNMGQLLNQLKLHIRGIEYESQMMWGEGFEIQRNSHTRSVYVINFEVRVKGYEFDLDFSVPDETAGKYPLQATIGRTTVKVFCSKGGLSEGYLDLIERTCAEYDQRRTA